MNKKIYKLVASCYNLDIRACIFLLIAVVVLFLPVMTGWRGIFHDDQAMEEFSRYYFVAHNFQEGILPLWDPQTWCGAIPFYARYYADTYYLPLWPFYFLTDLDNLEHSYWLLIIIPLFLHYLLASAGMFFFSRKALKCGSIPSCLAALVYVYSPTFVYAYGWQQVVSLQSWLPWLFVIYVSAVERLRLWKIGLGGLVFSFILTAATPSYWHFVAFLWAGLVFFLVIIRFRMRMNRAVGKLFLTIFLITILGVGLSSVYLFPFFDTLKYTQEHIELSSAAALSETVGSLHPVFLATLFLPNLFGNITGDNMVNLNPAPDVIFWEANMVGGVGISLLIILGLLFSFKTSLGGNKNQTKRYCAIMAGVLYVFAVLCVLGRYTPFYKFVIGWLPFIGSLPRPIHYRMIQCFAAAVLGAIGLDYLVISKFLYVKRHFQRWVWFYMVFSFLIVITAAIYPWVNKEEIYDEWSQLPASSVENYFSEGQAAGYYSPPFISKKIGLIFDGESEGEIRYADNNEVLPNGGVLLTSYHIYSKGWHEFKVNVPPNKFVWIYQKSVGTKIGNKRLKESLDSFYYDNDSKKWLSQPYSSCIYFYQQIRRVSSSLIKKVMFGSNTIKRAIVLSFLYWIIVSMGIIFCVHFLSTRNFGYFLAIIVLAELLVFGISAFYGGKFSWKEHSRPNLVRALGPLTHPMLQRVIGPLSTIASNPTLRIATNSPYHDNFFRLKKRFALMGYEMHPLEIRFKRAIEAAYEKKIGWFLYNTNPEPVHLSFLDHFSVGYYMNNNPEKMFSGGRCIPLSGEPELFVHTNPNALPRAYTQDTIIVVSEEEQLNQLVSGDLSKAVYVSSYLNLKNKGLISEDYRDRFNILQKENFIKRINLDNPNKIDVEIEVKIPSMLVLSEVWYPGWKVIVDGEPRPVHRVNYCQRGVWLEKGNHYVQFSFKPKSWQWGLIVSLGTALLLLVGTVLRITLMLTRKFSSK